MEWYESVKPYIAVSIIAPALAMLLLYMECNDPMDILYPTIVLFVCFPLIMMAVFFWMTGRGKRFINSIDWSKYTDEEASMAVSYTGFWLMITLIVMVYGLSLIFVQLWIGVAIAVVSFILMMTTLLKPLFTKVSRPLPSMDSVKALSVFLLVASISLVPTTFFLSEGMSDNNIEVILGEDSFTVKAPMFDHTIAYSDIEDIQYISDFDKGSRTMGYDDGRICSGTYKNGEGTYRLAAYRSVAPCIKVVAGGQMYAFNQDSDGSTLELFHNLKAKISA